MFEPCLHRKANMYTVDHASTKLYCIVITNTVMWLSQVVEDTQKGSKSNVNTFGGRAASTSSG